MKKLKIAIFCASEFPVPPTPEMKDIYAPLWLTHYITEELVKRGHNVTLVAGSDSKTAGKLVSGDLPSLAANKDFSRFYKQLTEIKKGEFYDKLKTRRAVIDQYDHLFLSKLYHTVLDDNFNLIYISMVNMAAVAFASVCHIPAVFTIHAPINPFTELFFEEYKKRYKNLHFMGISKSHISPAPDIFDAVVYNGVKMDNFIFNEKPSGNLLIAGRIAKQKGIVEGIEASQMAGEKLDIVGRHTEDDYWHEQVKPRLNDRIIYKGFLDYEKMGEAYKNAKALLMPIQWEEPFGLVMTEAMACGTPVIAFRRGSVPEIVVDGQTGFIVDTVKEMAEAVKKIDRIDRKACREHVEKNFSVKKMADRYEEEFLKIVEK